MTCPEDREHRREGGRGDEIFVTSQDGMCQSYAVFKFLISEGQGSTRIDVVPGGRLHSRVTGHPCRQARVDVSSAHEQICLSSSFPETGASSRQLGGNRLVADSLEHQGIWLQLHCQYQQEEHSPCLCSIPGKQCSWSLPFSSSAPAHGLVSFSHASRRNILCF